MGFARFRSVVPACPQLPSTSPLAQVPPEPSPPPAASPASPRVLAPLPFPVHEGRFDFEALLRRGVRCTVPPLPTSRARCSPGIPVLERIASPTPHRGGAFRTRHPEGRRDVRCGRCPRDRGLAGGGGASNVRRRSTRVDRQDPNRAHLAAGWFVSRGPEPRRPSPGMQKRAAPCARRDPRSCRRPPRGVGGNHRSFGVTCRSRRRRSSGVEFRRGSVGLPPMRRPAWVARTGIRSRVSRVGVLPALLLRVARPGSNTNLRGVHVSSWRGCRTLPGCLSHPAPPPGWAGCRCVTVPAVLVPVSAAEAASSVPGPSGPPGSLPVPPRRGGAAVEGSRVGGGSPPFPSSVHARRRGVEGCSKCVARQRAIRSEPLLVGTPTGP
jgi:hypothetical protein